MSEEELRKYYEVYTDAWKMFRSHSQPDGTNAFWEELVALVDKLYQKHGKSEFAKEIILATLDEIERIYKEGRPKDSGSE